MPRQNSLKRRRAKTTLCPTWSNRRTQFSTRSQRPVRKNPTVMPSTNSSRGTVPNRVWPLINRTVVLRYRFFLEQKNLAPSTINVRLAGVYCEGRNRTLLNPLYLFTGSVPRWMTSCFRWGGKDAHAVVSDYAGPEGRAGRIGTKV